MAISVTCAPRCWPESRGRSSAAASLPDGNIRWLLCQSTPEFDAQGHLVGCIGTLIDSTATRETLRASEERFRLAAERARVGVLDYDVAADRGLWSPRALLAPGNPCRRIHNACAGL